MRTHVALLRGVNVGGHAKVAMADLREVVVSLGHADVATYVNSGNVVLGAADPAADPAGLGAAIETALEQRIGFRPAVVVLARDELAEVVRANPFPQVDDPKRLHAVLRRDELGSEELAVIDAALAGARGAGSEDDAAVVGRTLYLSTPDGLGRSDLAARLQKGGRRSPMAAGTARNWATVTRLLAMLDEG